MLACVSMGAGLWSAMRSRVSRGRVSVVTFSSQLKVELEREKGVTQAMSEKENL